MIGLAIYGVGLLALVLALALAPSATAKGAQRPPVLSREQISSMLTEEVKGVNVDSQKALAELEAARDSFTRTSVSGRYNCLRHYRFYKAYSGRFAFEDPADQARYEEALEQPAG